MTVLASAGTSASSTPDTTIAEITAGAGKALYGWNAFFAHSTPASTQIRCTVTYDDATTTQIDTTAGTVGVGFANQGGCSIYWASFNQVAYSAKHITKVRIATLGTGTGTRYGSVSGEELPMGTYKPVGVSGQSASGTAGTVVADLQAGTDRHLTAWTVQATQTQAANTTLTVTVTYEDGTTDTLSTGANSLQQIHGNAGGLFRIVGGVATEIVTGDDKRVTRIRVTTGGSGTGTRVATIGANEERTDQPPQPEQRLPFPGWMR